jgi:hypothetical protein
MSRLLPDSAPCDFAAAITVFLAFHTTTIRR